MKRQLLSAVSAFVLMFQVACGSSADETSEVLSLNKCTGKPLSAKDLRLPRAAGFKHSSSKLISLASANHRARDQVALAGSDAILHAKFAYGIADKDLKDEPVDIYISKGCDGAFKKLGTVHTTAKENEKSVIENVKDSGGRIYASLSSLGLRGGLAEGRYQLLYVVQGDNSFAEAYLDVIPKGTKYVLTDIDGTLTTSEFAAALDVAKLAIKAVPSSKANSGSAAVMTALAKKGYRIFYLTARPEWLTQVTREWLHNNGYPQGTLHTSDRIEGAQGEAAKNYKIADIAAFKKNSGTTPTYAFGNKPSDVDAFAASGIAPKNSFFIKLEGDAKGGVIHDDYNKILPLFR